MVSDIPAGDGKNQNLFLQCRTLPENESVMSRRVVGWTLLFLSPHSATRHIVFRIVPVFISHMKPLIYSICRLDEGSEGSDMGLFLIGGHWLKILRQNSNNKGVS